MKPLSARPLRKDSTRFATLAAIILCVLGFASGVAAANRQEVTFTIVHAPSAPLREVYVLGDLPELGGGDLTHAVKLLASGGSNWRVTVSLPVNRTYTYRYYERLWVLPADPSNGDPIGDPITDHTDAVAIQPAGKMIYAHSSFEQPVLHWRQEPGVFQSVSLQEAGPGRTPAEKRWVAGPFGEARRPVEFFLTSADGAQRDPADDSTYKTPLDALLLQDAQLFTYVPATQVSAPRRDYEVTSIGLSSVTLYSSILGADYDIRVMLPRGYDEHRFRHYPVIYFSDGGFVWEDKRWFTQPCDADAKLSTELTRLGMMREVIQVAVDNRAVDRCNRSETRSRDLVPPGETFPILGCAGMVTGQADRFAAFVRDELKPRIDSQYRTLPDREHTAFTGISYGGLLALYLGWDFPDTFSRVGAQSIGTGGGAGTAFVARVHVEPKRPIRVYLDAGGFVGDFPPYQRSLAVRDDLLAKTPEAYVLERDLRHIVGAANHDHANWAMGARWPEMLPFLFPATEEPPECYDGSDNDGDGAIDYAPGVGGDDGCVSALDPSEQRNDCSDGIDNDGDGLADAGDPGCPVALAWPENPQCDDGVDNDTNGLVDLDDPKCQNPDWPYWEARPCGLGAELAVLLPTIAFLRRRARSLRSKM